MDLAEPFSCAEFYGSPSPSQSIRCIFSWIFGSCLNSAWICVALSIAVYDYNVERKCRKDGARKHTLPIWSGPFYEPRICTNFPRLNWSSRTNDLCVLLSLPLHILPPSSVRLSMAQAIHKYLVIGVFIWAHEILLDGHLLQCRNETNVYVFNRRS